MEERRRSRAYPGSNLQDSISNVKLVVHELGPGIHSREEISRALGAKQITGGTARKISAAVNFGLLQKSGGGYAVTQLARHVLKPLPGEEMRLLQECFFSVSLYKEIHDKYKQEGRIPGSLPTILERHFDIVSPNGEFATKVFKESAQYAGVLDAMGCFLSDLTEEPEDDGVSEQGFEPQSAANQVVPSRASELIPSAMPTSVSVSLNSPPATFTVKTDLTPAERDRIVSWIEKVLRPWLDFQVCNDLGEEDHA